MFVSIYHKSNLFNVHAMILIVHIFMNVNELCLNHIHKTCAVTLTGKSPPNRDPELQRTELVQDTKALMVQDTKLMMLLILDNERGVDVMMIVIFIKELFTLC